MAFLSVMTMFAVGNMLLKYKRASLPRPVRSNWVWVILAMSAVMAGAVGNIILQPDIVKYFAIYFLFTLSVVFIMFNRIRLLKILLYFIGKSKFLSNYFQRWVQSKVKEINSQSVLFFSKHGDLATINKAIQYIRDNSQAA